MNANDIQGFHVELTNMCTLKCPGCARTRFIEQWPQHWKNYNLDFDDFFNFFDIDLKNKAFNLCGDYGDPIYHPRMIDFVKELKHRNAVVTITTNGSYKSVNWWEELVDLLDYNDNVSFSVDGSPENFTKYRINGDWNSIEQGMKVVVEGKCHSEWKYLVFAYNEMDIDFTRKLSKEIGIETFKLDRSDRFDSQTSEYMPINVELLGDKFEAKNQFKNDQYSTVDPVCKKNKKEHFITAQGFYSPCCYVADHRFYFKTQFGKDKIKYNIKNNTITEILEKPEVVDFYNNLQNFPVCQYNCPKI